MGSECCCEVCVCLRALSHEDIDALEPAKIIEMALQLPIGVRETLEAQTRIRRGNGNSSDLAVVRAAARVCVAGRFHKEAV